MAVNEVARVYAGAMLELGKEKNMLGQFEEELGFIQTLLDDDADFRVFCESPGISRDSKKEFVDKVFEGRFSDEMVYFLKVLVDNGRLSELGSIDSAFRELLDEENNRLRVTVTGTASFDAAMLGKVKKALSEKFKKEIIIEEKTDASILGGIIIRVGDMIIDGSLVKDLNNIRNNLLTSKVRSEAAYED